MYSTGAAVENVSAFMRPKENDSKFTFQLPFSFFLLFSRGYMAAPPPHQAPPVHMSQMPSGPPPDMRGPPMDMRGPPMGEPRNMMGDPRGPPMMEPRGPPMETRGSRSMGLWVGKRTACDECLHEVNILCISFRGRSQQKPFVPARSFSRIKTRLFSLLFPSFQYFRDLFLFPGAFIGLM